MLRCMVCSPFQPSNLLHMMQAVHQMKLPPLLSRKRPQDRMIQQFAVRPKFFLATRNDGIHLGNLRPNLGQHFLRRHSARPRYRRGFTPRRQVAESYDDQRAPTLRPGWDRGQRLARWATRSNPFTVPV